MGQMECERKRLHRRDERSEDNPCSEKPQKHSRAFEKQFGVHAKRKGRPTQGDGGGAKENTVGEGESEAAAKAKADANAKYEAKAKAEEEAAERNKADGAKQAEQEERGDILGSLLSDLED